MEYSWKPAGGVSKAVLTSAGSSLTGQNPRSHRTPGAVGEGREKLRMGHVGELGTCKGGRAVHMCVCFQRTLCMVGWGGCCVGWVAGWACLQARACAFLSVYVAQLCRSFEQQLHACVGMVKAGRNAKGYLCAAKFQHS